MNVRCARLADVDAVAALHARAFEGEMGPVVGIDYLRALIRWFVDAPCGIVLVAEENDDLAGYVFGAPDGYGPRLTRTLLPAIVSGVLKNLPAVVAHPSFRRQVRSRVSNLVLGREPTSVIFDSTPKDVFSLVGIGTSSAYRGRGFGKALVRGFCGRVRARSIILDVFADNAPALALYGQCGFHALAEDGRVVRMIRGP